MATDRADALGQNRFAAADEQVLVDTKTAARQLVHAAFGGHWAEH